MHRKITEFRQEKIYYNWDLKNATDVAEEKNMKYDDEQKSETKEERDDERSKMTKREYVRAAGGTKKY